VVGKCVERVPGEVLSRIQTNLVGGESPWGELDLKVAMDAVERVPGRSTAGNGLTGEERLARKGIGTSMIGKEVELLLGKSPFTVGTRVRGEEYF
jgi:hypothetical protein